MDKDKCIFSKELSNCFEKQEEKMEDYADDRILTTMAHGRLTEQVDKLDYGSLSSEEKTFILRALDLATSCIKMINDKD